MHTQARRAGASAGTSKGDGFAQYFQNTEQEDMKARIYYTRTPVLRLPGSPPGPPLGPNKDRKLAPAMHPSTQQGSGRVDTSLAGTSASPKQPSTSPSKRKNVKPDAAEGGPLVDVQDRPAEVTDTGLMSAHQIALSRYSPYLKAIILTGTANCMPGSFHLIMPADSMPHFRALTAGYEFQYTSVLPARCNNEGQWRVPVLIELMKLSLLWKVAQIMAQVCHWIKDPASPLLSLNECTYMHEHMEGWKQAPIIADVMEFLLKRVVLLSNHSDALLQMASISPVQHAADIMNLSQSLRLALINISCCTLHGRCVKMDGSVCEMNGTCCSLWYPCLKVIAQSNSPTAFTEDQHASLMQRITHKNGRFTWDQRLSLIKHTRLQHLSVMMIHKYLLDPEQELSARELQLLLQVQAMTKQCFESLPLSFWPAPDNDIRAAFLAGIRLPTRNNARPLQTSIELDFTLTASDIRSFRTAAAAGDETRCQRHSLPAVVGGVTLKLSLKLKKRVPDLLLELCGVVTATWQGGMYDTEAARDQGVYVEKVTYILHGKQRWTHELPAEWILSPGTTVANVFQAVSNVPGDPSAMSWWSDNILKEDGTVKIKAIVKRPTIRSW